MSKENLVMNDFASIAEQFLEELDQHRGGVLQRYVDLYPQHAKDLVLLAAEIAIEDPNDHPVFTPPTHLRDRLLAGAVSAWDEAAHPITATVSLRERAKEYAGLAPRELAKRLRIGIDILIMLDTGGIQPATILPAFLSELAEVLGMSVAAVRAYLFPSSQNGLVSGVSYHAPRGHVAGAEPRVRTFEEALRESPLTTEADRDYWLAQANDPRLGDV